MRIQLLSMLQEGSINTYAKIMLNLIKTIFNQNNHPFNVISSCNFFGTPVIYSMKLLVQIYCQVIVRWRTFFYLHHASPVFKPVVQNLLKRPVLIVLLNLIKAKAFFDSISRCSFQILHRNDFWIRILNLVEIILLYLVGVHSWLFQNWFHWPLPVTIICIVFNRET